MEKCSFCRIMRGDLPSSNVYEDELCIAIMDLQPINPGHVLVIPKNHVTLVKDLDDSVTQHLLLIGKRVGAAIRHSDIEHDALCYLIADGDEAGQEIPHVHLHVFPRFKGDGFRFLYPLGYMQMTERDELDRLAQTIKAQLA